MTRRSKLWKAVVVIFVLINVAGAWWAARMEEPLHMATHVALLLPVAGIYLARRTRRRTEDNNVDAQHPVEDSMTRLEESLEGVALEVERIGEAQRFSARVLQERAERDGMPGVP